MFDLVDDERLKVNFDTSNPLVEGDDPVELARLVAEKVVHVHASDRYEDLEHCVAGEGCVPFPEIFQVLKAAGFDGWISLEAGGTRGEEGVVEGIRHVKEVWESA
jgi:sugar phosphate isomerase/epimerase